MNLSQTIEAARNVLRFKHRARGFSFVLLQWAANARRRAMAISTSPIQGDLFGGKA